MATNVKITKFVYDRSESVGDYPYTTTMFVQQEDTLTTLTSTNTNSGATADDDWAQFVLDENEWFLMDPDV